MNISDLLIIYLACGAPCGVYFFLQNRKNLSVKKLWLKSFLTVFVWIPYAFRLLNDFITKKSPARQDRDKLFANERLSEIQKLLLELQIDSPVKISPFEFREVLERYAGLTIASNFDNSTPEPAEKEVFRVALRKNPELGANCLRRRNRLRLLFHQTLARKDFLQIMTKLKFSPADAEKLKNLAIEFVEILNDPEAQNSLVEIFAGTLQSGGNFSVPEVEKEVWKPKEHKPSTANRIPARLQALTATAAANKKD